METEILWGVVNSDRTVLSGTGFTVGSKVETGVYTIIFDTDKSFDRIPAVTVTILLGSQAGDGRVGYLQNLQTDQFQIHIRNTSTQASEDYGFAFIAIGNQ